MAKTPLENQIATTVDSLIIQWAMEHRRLPLTLENAQRCLVQLKRDQPHLAGEHLAAAFIVESENWIPQASAPRIPEQFEGISIE